MQNLKTEQRIPNCSKFLTLTEASQFLNLKISRLRYEVFHKKIPYFKIGRSIRFSENDLMSWVLSQKQVVEVGDLNETM